MQSWEYEVVGLRGPKDEAMILLLDDKGKLGWELVSVVASITGDGYLAFFKKPAE